MNLHILVVLRNLYNNPDPFEDENLLCDSDINAITEACEFRDRWGECKVTTLLISETKSDYEKVLKKSASYGADNVIYAGLDDFDFSDSNAFSRIIAQLIKEMESTPDIVVFGRLAYDGDSVNIATQTAENLGWHRAVYSKEVLDLSTEKLTYKKALDDGAVATVEVPLPLVLHTIRRGGLRRQAKISDIIRAYNETEVGFLGEKQISEAVSQSSLGPHLTSPTQEIPPYINKGDMVVLNGTSDIDTAANIIETLRMLGFEPR